jgi:hypothetical protein
VAYGNQTLKKIVTVKETAPSMVGMFQVEPHLKMGSTKMICSMLLPGYLW